MAKVRTLVLRAPGTNCDVETSFAFEQAGTEIASAHVNELVRKEKRISDYQIVVFPGGFTYGDDISAGKILANEIKLKLGDDIQKFVEDGGLVLGICNGFQVLVKAGILPQPDDVSQKLTLSNNDSSRFECRWVYLSVDKQSPCVFTKGIDSLYLPIAHGEGKVMAEPKALKGLKVVLRYADEKGRVSADYPDNPNGSVDSIAGICDSSGRIFALMPHPERFLRWTQHPRWFREADREWGDGFAIFKNAVEWVKSA